MHTLGLASVELLGGQRLLVSALHLAPLLAQRMVGYAKLIRPQLAGTVSTGDDLDQVLTRVADVHPAPARLSVVGERDAVHAFATQMLPELVGRLI